MSIIVEEGVRGKEIDFNPSRNNNQLFALPEGALGGMSLYISDMRSVNMFFIVLTFYVWFTGSEQVAYLAL